MNWLLLTTLDGKPIHINMDHVWAMQRTKSGAMLITAQPISAGSYQEVTETPSVILRKIKREQERP